MKKPLAALALAASLGVAGPVRAALLVNGAGATFPFPLYSRWFAEYGTLRPEYRFNYQSIGSGGGIKQVTARTVDFGATDAPMTDAELARAPGIVHVPTVLGAVVVAYNLTVEGLKLTPEALAGLFLGTITRWNDPAIARDNAGLKLPDAPVVVIHRSDGSGTTAIFTDYLAKISPAWKSKVGAGKSVRWPAGLGAKGNEGVTGLVKSTPGTVGYLELAYARQNGLAEAALRNRDGAFVKPSLASTSAAAGEVAVPADFRVSITDAPGKDAYPIASFTYLLVERDQRDPARGEAIVQFLWWAIHQGQSSAPALDYAPLPKSVVTAVERRIASLTVNGRPVPLAPAR